MPKNWPAYRHLTGFLVSLTVHGVNYWRFEFKLDISGILSVRYLFGRLYILVIEWICMNQRMFRRFSPNKRKKPILCICPIEIWHMMGVFFTIQLWFTQCYLCLSNLNSTVHDLWPSVTVGLHYHVSRFWKESRNVLDSQIGLNYLHNALLSEDLSSK